MRRKIPIIVLTFIAILLFVICYTRGNDKPANHHADETNNNGSDITILSPMTLSNNDLYPILGLNQNLRIQMVKGKYYETWTPGPYMGTIWEGDFIIELTDDLGNIVSQIDLSTVYSEPLIFTSPFQIEFDDYNNDSDIDFTIGQYVSSNGREYKLFTIRKDGKIDVLSVKDHNSLLISNTTGYYSTKLTKKTDTSFVIEYYDNSISKNIENEFEWNGKEFIKN